MYMEIHWKHIQLGVDTPPMTSIGTIFYALSDVTGIQTPEQK